MGERVRRARTKAHRKQAAIAGLCGITVDYLSQIERGLKVPSVDVLMALAHELRVPASSLLGEPTASEPVEISTTPSVAQALLGFGVSPTGSPTEPVQLRERVEGVWRTWQTSKNRYTEAAEVLPALIADTEHALRACKTDADSTARREVLRCAADLYGMLRSYCRRTGRIDLSLMAADRARRAAEDADDPIRLAAAHWNLGHVLLGDGQPDGATDLAARAVEELAGLPETRETAAMSGALELVGVTASARRARWWEARERLRTYAVPLAETAGEGNTMWTVFGPTNVELHQLSIEMEAGEAEEALRIADQINTMQLPSVERRFTFALEVARCYALRREDAAVLVHLLDMAEMAPEDLSHNQPARALVKQLLMRARPTYRKQVTALADRLGIA